MAGSKGQFLDRMAFSSYFCGGIIPLSVYTGLTRLELVMSGRGFGSLLSSGSFRYFLWGRKP